MTNSLAHCFKSRLGQIKIQEMAFVLLALILLAAFASIFYFSFTLSNLTKVVNSQRQADSLETLRKLASMPEFSLPEEFSCSSCIDFDKALMLKERTASYSKDFWHMDYLSFEVLSPIKNKVECTKSNYPDCSTLTILNSSEIGTPVGAFVSLCHVEFSQRGFIRCELGKVYASGKGVFNG